MRGRGGGGGNSGGRKPANPLTRSYESNGPDVKVRGTAAHVAEKYQQLARDAHSSGDRISAESYLQHAEHYLRIIAAAQAQIQASQPEPGNEQTNRRDDQPNRGNEQREQREPREQRGDGRRQRGNAPNRSDDNRQGENRPAEDRPAEDRPSEDIVSAPAAIDANPAPAGSEDGDMGLPAFLRNATRPQGNDEVEASGDEPAAKTEAPRRRRRPSKAAADKAAGVANAPEADASDASGSGDERSKSDAPAADTKEVADSA